METIKKLIQSGLISHDEIMEYLRDYHQNIDWEADQMEDSGEDVSGTFEEPKLLYRALFPERGPDTEYVLFSTAYKMKETYVFPSNKDGEYLSWEKMVALAERYAEYDDYEKEDDWLDTDKVLAKLMKFSGHTYEFVKSLHEDKNHKVLLYKRTDL